MEYITFIEKNYKKNEIFFFYLQFTGNEEALRELNQLVGLADFTVMDGEFSEFMMDIQTKFSEEVVNDHCRLNYGVYSYMFQKVNGKFVMPEKLKNEDMETYEIAEYLDDCFFGLEIRTYFR